MPVERWSAEGFASDLAGGLRRAREIEMVVVAASGVEGGLARGAAGVGLKIGGDGKFGAAGTAKDGLVVPFGLRPGLNGVAG
jgi:hypothetical protein